MPADQLPSFMPGHEAGVMRVHMKHGVLAGAIGVVLIIAGWVMGRGADKFLSSRPSASEGRDPYAVYSR